MAARTRCLRGLTFELNRRGSSYEIAPIPAVGFDELVGHVAPDGLLV